MLTDKEKEYFRELLERIELRDLVTLTDTVTNRVVSAETKKEAIEAILLFTANAPQLLRRKKMKREYLYHYLAKKGHVEPASADKPYLCRRILNLWGSKSDEPDADYDAGFDDDYDTNEDSSKNTDAKSQALDLTEGQTLAEHFVPWFFDILNSFVNEPSSSSSSNNKWGGHHFWEDAKCNVTMVSEQYIQDECQGSQAVSTKLAECVSKEKLYFNPNISGIKGEINPHGLVQIIAGGTVHRFNSCLGIFEQSFGLIRDPHSQNNWKIKYTNLRLKSQSSIQGNSAALSDGNSGLLALKK